MPATAGQAGTTAVEARVLEIIRELLKELGSLRAAESATLDSLLDHDLGLGSLERVELLVRCEAAFGARLPDEVASKADTARQWATAIASGPAGRIAAARYRIEQPSRLPPPAPESACSMVEVLRGHAELDPDRVQAHLLEGDTGQDISYRQLIETASRVAAGLAASGLRRDETVAIMLPTCADFFYAFFGVMLAGGIPVPIYPPARPDKIEEYVRRQIAILTNAEVRFLISFERVKTVADILKLSLSSLTAVTSVEALARAGAGQPAVAAAPSETAFIQYTSGSTGDPKGVVLSHANILANIRGIGWAVKVRPTDIVVSWLPLYHDMGLIGSWLFSVYYALPITVFSPLAFLSRPERWLWALHDSRGTLCPAPNFSYELCARKIPEEAIEGLDLSAWRIAINAGEAVLPETLERFHKRFAPHGFRAESFVPCYGLAESSVALAFPPVERAPVIDRIRRNEFELKGKALPAGASEKNILRFVANGRPLPSHEIKIVDDSGNESGERTQGRLLFRGPSRTAGYFRNPDASSAVIDDKGWMDSGDLAYWAGGEIYVTGRRKDLIIKSGRNIIPQEVEAAAAEAAGVRRGCVAAFGSRDPDSGTERLVVVAETRATAEDELGRIEADVVARIAAVLGIPPDRVELIAPNSIPKTSSGKIRRNATRTLFEQNRLSVTRRAPWIQIAKLWFENLGQWVYLKMGWARESIRRSYARAVVTVIGTGSGALARTLPRPNGAAPVVGMAARMILALTAHPITTLGTERIGAGEPALFMANRAGIFDPLVLAAVIRRPFFLADAEALRPLPGGARFLLSALIVPAVKVSAPRGGTLRDRIHARLKRGQAVLVFPDGPAATAAHRARFRLDSLHAAALTSALIYPVGIHGTPHILTAHEPGSMHAEAKISVGEPMAAAADEPRELASLREQVREALSILVS
jgi:acyl carrier protein